MGIGTLILMALAGWINRQQQDSIRADLLVRANLRSSVSLVYPIATFTGAGGSLAATAFEPAPSLPGLTKREAFPVALSVPPGSPSRIFTLAWRALERALVVVHPPHTKFGMTK